MTQVWSSSLENESSHLYYWSQPVLTPSGSYSFPYVFPYSTIFPLLSTSSFLLLSYLAGRSCQALRTPWLPIYFLPSIGITGPWLASQSCPNTHRFPVTWCKCTPPSAAQYTWTFVEAQSLVLRPFPFTVLEAFIHLLGCTYHSSAEDPQLYISRLISWDY